VKTLVKTLMKGKSQTLILFLVFLFFSADYGTAAEKGKKIQDIRPAGRPKIGLVLSGGGARGAAHIGVLKVLEEMRVPIDYIVGTSMGSIVGGLYASGMSPAEIEETIVTIDWENAFNDNILREDRPFRRKRDDDLYLIKHKAGIGDDGKIKLPVGVLQGQTIDIIFKELTLPVSNIKDFDQLSIPFRAVATDITTGEVVVLSSGDLGQSMRASMSIPSIFAPMEMDGRLLVDGGVSNNLPVDVARDMGAEIIIAVDISTPLKKREELTSALSITGQLTGILTRRNTEAQIATLSNKDIFIVPDLSDISTADFSESGKVIPRGKVAAEKHREQLAGLAISEADYANLGNAKPERKTATPVIEFVKLDNQSRVSDEVIMARLHVKTGEPLDVQALDQDIGRIYGLELFQTVTYEIIEEDDRNGLLINSQERSWGPNYLQLGLQLSDDFDGDNSYNLGASYMRTAINRLNGEWRTGLQIGENPGIFTELFQPLDVSSRYFIHPRLFYQNNKYNVFSSDDDLIAEYRVTRYGIDIGAGREFGTWGEARLGFRRYSGETEIRIGAPVLPEDKYDSGELYAQLAVDKLDNLNFPRKGHFGRLEYIWSDEALGADNDFDQILFKGGGAFTWDRHTLIAAASLYATPDNDAPVQNWFQLGGLFKLSGYQVNELSGQQLALLQLIYMRRIGDFNLMPTYLGGSLEGGNTWDDIDDIKFDNLIAAGSLFIGIDTVIGPFYFAYGIAENNKSSVYFYLGKIF
jgi:NTE family protein